MRERDIELKLRDAVKAVGGLCWKFTSPGTSGVPDRIVLMPKGRIAFVETKAPGDVPRKIQLKKGINSLEHWAFRFMCWMIKKILQS